MTALWYKWYIHLREEGGYSIGTALVAGWWNASVNENTGQKVQRNGLTIGQRGTTGDENH